MDAVLRIQKLNRKHAGCSEQIIKEKIKIFGALPGNSFSSLIYVKNEKDFNFVACSSQAPLALI